MTDKKHQIHEFSPTTYPFKLWVSVNPSFEDVKDKFWLLNNDNAVSYTHLDVYKRQL